MTKSSATGADEAGKQPDLRWALVILVLFGIGSLANLYRVITLAPIQFLGTKQPAEVLGISYRNGAYAIRYRLASGEIGVDRHVWKNAVQNAAATNRVTVAFAQNGESAVYDEVKGLAALLNLLVQAGGFLAMLWVYRRARRQNSAPVAHAGTG